MKSTESRFSALKTCQPADSSSIRRTDQLHHSPFNSFLLSLVSLFSTTSQESTQRSQWHRGCNLSCETDKHRKEFTCESSCLVFAAFYLHFHQSSPRSQAPRIKARTMIVCEIAAPS